MRRTERLSVYVRSRHTMETAVCARAVVRGARCSSTVPLRLGEAVMQMLTCGAGDKHSSDWCDVGNTTVYVVRAVVVYVGALLVRWRRRRAKVLTQQGDEPLFTK